MKQFICKMEDEWFNMWSEIFVSEVLKHAHLNVNEVIISDFDDKRILLLLDGKPYSILKRNTYDVDERPLQCTATIEEYSFYKKNYDGNGYYDEEIDSGLVKVKWNAKNNVSVPLIRPYDFDLKDAWQEKVHDNFISREEFINRTGIFVTPDHFDYIYDIEFKESDKTVDEFVDSYEKESYEVIEIPLKGTFKYLCSDYVPIQSEHEDCEVNIWELLNTYVRLLTKAFEDKHKLYNECMDLIHDLMDANKTVMDIVTQYEKCINGISSLISQNHLNTLLNYKSAVPATNIPS